MISGFDRSGTEGDRSNGHSIECQGVEGGNRGDDQRRIAGATELMETH